MYSNKKKEKLHFLDKRGKLLEFLNRTKHLSADVKYFSSTYLYFPINANRPSWAAPNRPKPLDLLIGSLTKVSHANLFPLLAQHKYNNSLTRTGSGKWERMNSCTAKKPATYHHNRNEMRIAKSFRSLV